MVSSRRILPALLGQVARIKIPTAPEGQQCGYHIWNASFCFGSEADMINTSTLIIQERHGIQGRPAPALTTNTRTMPTIKALVNRHRADAERQGDRRFDTVISVFGKLRVPRDRLSPARCPPYDPDGGRLARSGFTSGMGGPDSTTAHRCFVIADGALLR